MEEIIRDQAWQFVGAIVGIISLGIMILGYLWQRQKRGFEHELIASTSLLSVAEEIEGKVQIRYENEPVEKVHLFVLKLINSGRVSIIAKDFVRPVTIVFSESTEILSADISEEQPDDIGAEIEYSDNAVTLQPTLLNGGDTVTIKCLLSNFDRDYSVVGRIVGVKKIKNADEVNPALIITVIVVLLLIFIMMLLIAIYAMKLIADVIQSGDYITLMQNEPMFRLGFLSAIQLGLLFGLLLTFLKILRYVRDRITQFTRPTSPRPDY